MKNGFYGIIDFDGLEVVKPLYDHIGKFKKGRAKVMKGGKYGIIDSDGLEIVPL